MTPRAPGLTTYEIHRPRRRRDMRYSNPAEPARQGLAARSRMCPRGPSSPHRAEPGQLGGPLADLQVELVVRLLAATRSARRRAAVTLTNRPAMSVNAMSRGRCARSNAIVERRGEEVVDRQRREHRRKHGRPEAAEPRGDQDRHQQHRPTRRAPAAATRRGRRRPATARTAPTVPDRRSASLA